MADFCTHCSIEHFGKDFGNFKYLISAAELAAGYRYSTVLCEGCGPIQVDQFGNCVSSDCGVNHNEDS